MLGCDSCCEKWKNELKFKNCYLQHVPSEDLVRSQWQSRCKSIYYLVYRLFMAILYISAVAVSMATFTFMAGKYFIYLTNWGILLCMITQVYAAILVTRWHWQTNFLTKVNQSNTMPTAFKIYWWLHNTALTLSIIITIIYWSILHNTAEMPVNAANVLTHATNSVGMFLDVLIVAYPIRIYHVAQPICFGLVYAIFSIIYFFAGGTDIYENSYIYNVLDWNTPGYAILTVVGTVLLALIIHTTLFWIYQLRTYIHWKYFAVKLILPYTTNTLSSDSPTTAANSTISMVIGEYQNSGFKASTEKI